MRWFSSPMRVIVSVSIAVIALVPSRNLAQQIQLTLVDEQSTWSYEASGTDLGTEWRATGYDDATWDSGAGILGFGETYINTIVPYGPNPSDKYRTTYFRHSFTVGFDPGSITQLHLFANYDDGCVVYLNGSEVARRSMPTETIEYTTFASSHESGTYELVDLTEHVGLLSTGTNVLAVEAHQTSPSSSDLAWDARLEADTSQIQFMWSGTVTASSFRVKAKLLSEGLVARLMVDQDSLFSVPMYSSPDTAFLAENNRVVDLSMTGLAASTTYYYALELGGGAHTESVGRVRTCPP
ncbi:MAG: hypothetical protein GF341_00160, partial [candidate division Zixibacteria bacterium]|nr:hypothetical protein [candidate division Zixibacteria bacterium]